MMTPLNPSQHAVFRYRTAQELEQAIDELKLNIHLQEDISILKQPLKIHDVTIPNRLAIHPMEGCDGDLEGNPSELTRRRYQRFGTSGAGLIWFEATAIQNEGRANPRQLYLNESNKNQFLSLLRLTEDSENEVQVLHPELDLKPSAKILQITHSGRYSRPSRVFPQRMYNYPVLDTAYHQKPEDGIILSDEELEALPEYYYESAKLAKEIGFDGVDIKSCHRYLLSESFSAFTRKDSIYGGEKFENRTRLLKSIIDKVMPLSSPTFLITLRMNIFDAIPYPYGFGVDKDYGKDPLHFSNRDAVPNPDLREPVLLLQHLYDKGVRLVNLTIANPYFNAFVSRPYDQALEGLSVPNEHPLVGVNRFLTLSAELRKQLPKDFACIGTGYSWLRQFGPQVAAAEISAGNIDLVGWGRMAFANPEFGIQTLSSGMIDPKKTCIACSKCTELMRKKQVTGCVIRDGKTYLPYYKGEKKAIS